MNETLHEPWSLTNITEPDLLRSRQRDNIIALILSVTVGVIATIAHVLVILLTLKTESIRHMHKAPFIIASISMAEAILSLYLGIWFPLTYLTQRPFGTQQAAFTAVLWFSAADNLDVLLAVNRYVATYRPMQYKNLFSARRTRLYIAMVWLSSILVSVPYAIPGCRIIVDYAIYHVTFEKTPCGHRLEFYSQVFASGALIATALNLLTFHKVKQRTKNVSGSLQQKDSKRRVKRETSFFLQSCVTSTTTSLIVIIVDYVSLAFEDKWSLFVMRSLLPLTLMAIDGYAVLFLSGVVRRNLAQSAQQQQHKLSRLYRSETSLTGSTGISRQQLLPPQSPSSTVTSSSTILSRRDTLPLMTAAAATDKHHLLLRGPRNSLS